MSRRQIEPTDLEEARKVRPRRAAATDGGEPVVSAAPVPRPRDSAGAADPPADAVPASDSRGSRRTPKFRRRAEERPDELLDAALDLFIEKGFAAARVEDIARRAGLSKGAVYLYFPSKQAMMEALVRRAVVPITERAAEVLGSFNGSPREALRMMFFLFGQAMANPRVLAIPKLIVREAGTFPELAEMYRREVIERGLPLIVGLVRRGIEAGVFRPVDPELAVRDVIGPLAMHVLMAEVFGLVPSNGLDLPRLVESHMDILCNGLLAREAEK
jgi:AcrR family transcriptional regulator